MYKEIVRNIEIRNYGNLKNWFEYTYLNCAMIIKEDMVYLVLYFISYFILYELIISFLNCYFLIFDFSKEKQNNILNTLNSIIPIIIIIYGLFKYYHSLIDKKETVKSILDNKEKKEETNNKEEEKGNINKEKTTNKDKKDTTYILIIDDIDRLNKGEIIKLFNCIKSNIDLPHFIIIFLYERNLINGILKEYYKQDSFLDKIVRMQIDLPAVNRIYIEKYFYDKITDILKLNNIENGLTYNLTYSNIIEHIFKNNLRNVKRFLRQFYADYNMMKKYKEEIEINDFILIEITKHFENELYNFIKENREDFINLENEIKVEEEYNENIAQENKINDKSNKDSYISKKFKYFIEKELKKNIQSNETKILIKIINALFYIKNVSPTNRINDSKSFYKYFRLDIGDLDFTKKEYNELKINFDNYRNFIKDFEMIKYKKLNELEKYGITEEDIKISLFNTFEKYIAPCNNKYYDKDDKYKIYDNEEFEPENLIAILIYLLLPFLENKNDKEKEKYNIVSYFITIRKIDKVNLDLLFDLLNNNDVRYKIILLDILFNEIYIYTSLECLPHSMLKNIKIVFEELKNIDDYIYKKYYIDKLLDDNGIFNVILKKIDEFKNLLYDERFIKSTITNIECLMNNFATYFDCIESKIDEIAKNKNIEFFEKFLKFYSKLLKEERNFNYIFPKNKDLIKSNFTEDKFINFLKNKKINKFILEEENYQLKINILNYIIDLGREDLYNEIINLYNI